LVAPYNKVNKVAAYRDVIATNVDKVNKVVGLHGDQLSGAIVIAIDKTTPRR
jgi:hypothetical protein